MSTSPPRPDRLNRIIRPLEELLAGRGSRMAEPGRMLFVSLCFLFLFFRLRRMAGMVAGAGVVRAKARRALMTRAAEISPGGTPDLGAAIAVDPGTERADIAPPRENFGPIGQKIPEQMPPYGAYLLRLIQQPEIRALLEANPQLKPSLRRLLRLLGEQMPLALARPPRPSSIPRPHEPKPAARATMAPRQWPPGRLPKSIPDPDWHLAPLPEDWPPTRFKVACPPWESRVYFVAIIQQ